MQSYGAVDLGATNTRALVAGPDGTELGRARRPTPEADGAAIAAAVVDTLRRACDAAGVPPTALAAVGTGTIGPLDLDAGAVVDSPNVPADRVELAAALREATGAPVTLRNDAVAAVHGERRFADLPANGVYLTLSTGVGTGAVVDDHVLGGERGNAAEMGHVTLVPDGRRCGCGGHGHWEAYCSGANIPAYARHIHETEDVPTELALDDLDAAAIFEAADRDPLAGRVVERVGRWNAQGVADVVHAYAPLIVHVGGAVALGNPDLVLDPIRERLPELVVSNVPDIRLASLGEDAVVRGALARAIRAT